MWNSLTYITASCSLEVSHARTLQVVWRASASNLQNDEHMASEQLDAAVVASTLAQEDGCRVLHIVRLRTSYACSACWSFPPLTTSAGAPRYVVVYAAAARSLLGEGLRCTRNALTADGRTLDTPAAEPRDLGGALVAFIEVGVLAKDLLRPSPRHFFVLNGEAGEAVFSTPEGDALRAAVTDPTLGVVTSRAFKLKLVGIANGFVRKLRGLAMPRVARKAARRGGEAEPTAERLLEALPIADVLAHLELCQSWLTLATNGNHSYVGHLQELRDGVARALEPGVSVPSVGLASYLDQWLAATTAAMPAADKSTETKDTERSAQIRAIVANSLLTIREADLESFAADHPEAVGAGEISEQGLSVRLRSLLQMLDPHGLLPPHQIVFAVQSGSAMYNLATATSDEDYLLVFVRSPGELLAFEPPADQIEFKGETLRFGEDKGGVVEGSAMVSALCNLMESCHSRYGALTSRCPCCRNLDDMYPCCAREIRWYWNLYMQRATVCCTARRCGTNCKSYVIAASLRVVQRDSILGLSTIGYERREKHSRWRASSKRLANTCTTGCTSSRSYDRSSLVMSHASIYHLMMAQNQTVSGSCACEDAFA